VHRAGSEAPAAEAATGLNQEYQADQRAQGDDSGDDHGCKRLNPTRAFIIAGIQDRGFVVK
jgi:hypothetical protein